MEKVSVQVYKQDGKAGSKIDLPADIFGVPMKADLLHQVTNAMLANQRAGNAHTKHRGEVSGTGKKPWRQKGTGNARHGSKRSPIWVGGGIAHGPRSDRDWSQKVNKKMRQAALRVALSAKLRDTQMLFVDQFTADKPSTKQAKTMLDALAGIEGFATLNTMSNPNNVCVVLSGDETDAAILSLRNFPHVSIKRSTDINALDVSKCRYIVVVDPQAFVDTLTGSNKAEA